MAFLSPKWNVEMVLKNFETVLKKSQMQNEKKKELLSVFKDLMNQSEKNSFVEQVSCFNHDFWDQIQPETDVGEKTQYLMAPLEVIILECILLELKKNSGNWICQILTNPDGAKKILNALNGVFCFWNTSSHQGTFLFFGIDEKNRPLKIWLEGENLVTEKTKKKYNLARGDVITALENKELIPAPSLCFLYLTFFIGMELFGGLFQVLYLPLAQKRLLTLCKTFLNEDDLLIIGRSQCNFYLNFEKRKISDGGLLKMVTPTTRTTWEQYQNAKMIDEVQGCLRFILTHWK